MMSYHSTQIPQFTILCALILMSIKLLDLPLDFIEHQLQLRITNEGYPRRKTHS